MPQYTHIVCAHCNVVNRIPSARLGNVPKCGACKKALFTGTPIELGAHNFSQFVTRNDIPVLVDFWATWCGPCKMMAPAYVEAAQKLEPGLLLCKVNTEQAQDLAAQYRIQSIPTLVLFRNKQEIARQAGTMRAADIVRWVQQELV